MKIRLLYNLYCLSFLLLIISVSIHFAFLCGIWISDDLLIINAITIGIFITCFPAWLLIILESFKSSFGLLNEDRYFALFRLWERVFSAPPKWFSILLLVIFCYGFYNIYGIASDLEFPEFKQGMYLLQNGDPLLIKITRYEFQKYQLADIYFKSTFHLVFLPMSTLLLYYFNSEQ